MYLVRRMKGSLERLKRLLEQANKDLEIGCYDKLLEELVGVLLGRYDEKIPRRDDKPANSIENRGLKNIDEIPRILYLYRKIANY